MNPDIFQLAHDLLKECAGFNPSLIKVQELCGKSYDEVRSDPNRSRLKVFRIPEYANESLKAVSLAQMIMRDLLDSELGDRNMAWLTNPNSDEYSADFTRLHLLSIVLDTLFFYHQNHFLESLQP
jgi:hypothetical protein